ncbi:hypothetical protein ACFVYC_18595 [Pseudarthrobacter sp. NPDC058329]|uniref:hypothetical protein n=1 Tax=Pseudarthrobacter sp. NPDC058329 TaxID=3346448 RepID=UPI0036DED699
MTDPGSHLPPLLEPSMLEKLRNQLNGDEGIWAAFITVSSGSCPAGWKQCA